jgi:predicted RecA/RadA family phage recombinase
MKNLVEDGVSLRYTVGATPVKSGDVVVVGDLAGIAVIDGIEGETIALYIEGVYSLPKGTDAINKGQKVYVNITDGVTTIVSTATGNTFIGYAWEPAAAADETVNVKLSY